VPIRCRKLREIEKALDHLRHQASTPTAVQLEQLAEQLGRKKHPTARQPTYFSTFATDLAPLNIPGPGRELRPVTAMEILDQLDEDVLRLCETCEEDEEDGERHG
jgi:hypothetical protein